MNRWNIPAWMEKEIIERDRYCVYCRIEFASISQDRKRLPTWEHIVNDARIINLKNIARCCSACNASKGAKDLAIWLESSYCKKLGITKETVAEVIKCALVFPPTLP